MISARDTIGHGTHTALIAAGNHVKGVSFYGLAQGTARGVVPSARVAAHTTCFSIGCTDEAILTAFDDAISDTVDIITISIAANEVQHFEENSIAIGAFHALERNILTVNGAGTSGNLLGTVINVAPWMLVIATSNTDRQINDKAVLGNGEKTQVHHQHSGLGGLKSSQDYYSSTYAEVVKGKKLVLGRRNNNYYPRLSIFVLNLLEMASTREIWDFWETNHIYKILFFQEKGTSMETGLVSYKFMIFNLPDFWSVHLTAYLYEKKASAETKSPETIPRK